jgi:hypothetical protein
MSALYAVAGSESLAASKACQMLSIPLAWWFGVLTVTQLVVVELVIGSCRVVFRPAYQSHLPEVVAREQLTVASGHLRASDSVAMLAGPELGGLLVQAVSAPSRWFSTRCRSWCPQSV